MAYAARPLAPVAAPDPPKPPQLNIVASALMPDVETDTLGPEADGTTIASAGWTRRMDEIAKRRAWDKPPGDVLYRDTVERYNALVAAIETMSDLEQKQAEEEAGVTVDSLPKSIFAAVKDSRWTGGFAYAPENQYRAVINDACSQLSDLPYLRGNGMGAVQTPSTAPSNSGGTLSAAASPYDYLVVPVFADGSVGNPTAALPATIASGSTGSVAVSWTATTAATEVGYAVFGRFPGSYQLLGTVAAGTLTFTDTGASSPTLASTVPLGNLPQVGYVPFTIQVEDETSAFQWAERDYVGRALRLLDFITPNALERELWSGAYAQAGPVFQSNFPSGLNAFFTQTGTPASGGSSLVPIDLTPNPAAPPSVARGIQILEDYLANSGGGGQGMLHVAPETSPNLLGARRLGALLLSVMDNIIVPGSGYPTSGAQGPIGNAHAGASATTAWMFATDLVSVRLDDPQITPWTLAEALSRGDDRIRIRAQRFGAATWDGARLGAVLVTLAT